ncbi:MAG TPA: type II toxin-antitoxin system RelE/ParE family toxin [Salinimicrobium sp.]|nr:type II toxin-antitoxin system RelE/ParE family toxin [Salinimicrobium sp.]
MNIDFTKKYRKSFSKIKSKKVRKAAKEAAEKVMAAKDQRDIPLKKLSGFKNAYRIKIGDYRIGVRIEQQTIYFAEIGHRKDIYDMFP